MAGLLLLVRRRNPQGDRAGVIDSLIITVGIALLSWVFLVAPNIHLSGLTVLEKAVSAAYPLGDILLLAAAIRLAVDNGKRAPAFYLLVGSIVSLLAVDSAYTYALLTGAYNHQLSYDVGWIAYYLLWGAAALHPSMRTLEEPALDVAHAPDPAPPRPARRRVPDRARASAPGRRVGDPDRLVAHRRLGRSSSCSSSPAWPASSARRSERPRASSRSGGPASISSRRPAASR